jgi:hypothetical protein
MKDVSVSFGVLIAFVLPAFVTLWAASYFSDIVRGWLESKESINGFLFASLASLALGVFISGVRWVIFDRLINPQVGLERPDINFGAITKTEDGVRAFNLTTEEHYRYYQFYSNTVIAVVIAYAARAHHLGFFANPSLVTRSEIVGFVIFAVAEGMLYASAYDSLKKHDGDLAQLNSTYGGKT